MARQFPPFKVNIRKSQSRVDLVEALNRTTVQEKATLVDWQRAIACPCTTTATVHATQFQLQALPIQCPTCGGIGRIYGEAQETIMMLADASNHVQVFTLWGELSKGATEITALPENLLAEFDRITLKEGHVTLTECCLREAVIERPRYEISRRTLVIGSGDGMMTPLEITVGVTDLHKASSTGVVSSTSLVEGVDFVVTDDGYIDWTLGDGLGSSPAVGSFYSIRYFARPVYIVRDHPYIRRDFYELIKGELVFRNHPTKAIGLQEWLGLTNPPITGRGPRTRE